MEKKYIKDINGQRVLPITSVDAVIDSSGNSAETLLENLRTAYNQLSRTVRGKANIATTIAGYGITDSYTKAAVDSMVAALTQSNIVVTETLPATGNTNTIYRVKGAASYSDNMYYGGQWIELASYNNATDTVPTKDSGNLVTSGGVFSHLDALDVSELNQSNNTPTPYNSLENALAAVPAEYQKGGMMIKYLEDISGVYRWYKLLKPTWSTAATDWSYMANDILMHDNQEFIRVYTDSEGKILWGIQHDGNVVFGAGVPKQVRDYVLKKIAEIDFTDLIENIKRQLDEKVDKEAGKSLIDADVSESFSTADNPEWLKVVTDSEGKVIAGIRKDGSTYIADLDAGDAIAAVLAEFEERMAEIEERMADIYDDIDAKMALFDAVFSEFTDPEGRIQITTDADNKVLSYRDKEGVLHENYLAVDKKLDLSDEAMTDFQQALKAAGFRPGGGGDFSDREFIELPEPKHYALLNIDVDYLPTNDGDVRRAVIQYYDGLGNSFKMDAEIEAQGQTSRVFAYTGGKGNYTLDLSKDVKFGSWVPQDSFHLKGAAKDVTRAILPTSYKWAYMMQEFLNARPNRVLLKDDSKTTTTSASGDRFTDWGDGARCLPDGFPVELYINGDYYGLYAFQLKKHRKNYSMDKKDYTSLFLDADRMMSNNYTHGIWNDGPDAIDPDRAVPAKWWTGFDIKGPKDLICMDGSEFDGDAPKELIDDTSTVYDASNKKHKGSATTKAIIRGFQTKYLEVKTLIDNNDTEAAKAKFEENFDKDACIFAFVYNCLMKNADSVKKNTLWGTYKNGKIFPALWDLDGMYGTGWVGNSASAPSTSTFNTYANAAWPLALLWTLYEDEIKATYAELRSNGIISVGTWHDIVYNQWIDRIGEEAYKRDMERWPETPSYRENHTNTEYWTELGLTDSPGSTPVWNESLSVNANDVVVIRCHTIVRAGLYMVWMRYRANVANTGVCPVTKFYTEFPIVGGFFDSPRRWEKWIARQIELCDSLMGYTE